MGISIKEPCHEDWAKMTSTAKGAFCQACAKEVIDFTGKSPIEIKQLLAQEISNKSQTCGRITNYQLDQLNDDFFQWKSEQETFRAIWIFSLVAVFGLTLFSCQNTLSREMINKLNSETKQILADDSSHVELADVDSSDADQKMDSVRDVAIPSVIDIVRPWEIVTYMGTLPYDDLRVHPLITCEIFMGDVVLSGFVSIDPGVNKYLGEIPLLAFPVPVSSPLPPNTSLPIVTPSGDNPSQSSGNMTAGGDKKFDAFIHPNPVDITSRLYLRVHELTTLKITLHQKGETSPLRSGTSSFVTGQHEVDLQLYNLQKGLFQLRLCGDEQISLLDFEV